MLSVTPIGPKLYQVKGATVHLMGSLDRQNVAPIMWEH